MKVPKLKIVINFPNILTLFRFVLVPVFLYFLFQRTLLGFFLALVVFGLAALTDLIDGWLARKWKQETEFGKFLDPLADKFLVISSLVAFIVLDPYLNIFDFWMILIIVGRDVLITVMRYLAIKRGKSLRTSRFGKIKTAFQMISIVFIIIIYGVKKSGIYNTHEKLTYVIMLIVTVFTAISGVRYVMTNWQLFFPAKKIRVKN